MSKYAVEVLVCDKPLETPIVVDASSEEEAMAIVNESCKPPVQAVTPRDPASFEPVTAITWRAINAKLLKPNE
ncbi:hypothetical protein [Marinobacter xestospongiae]|uniref:hypothetical protein n=1 Tax=Marinobacter xestospongiae TaxID=994319 RepID=UPI00200626E0|nr:hypothetical protein [Marinobacter xestospongiae]MCK7568813.1 hypothetical protein [Marinobacter xestospongiae]